MIVERILLLPPGAFIVRIGCFALRVVRSRILKPLLSDLMLVPLVTGDAATDRPEHPMARHMARERARSGSRQAANGMSRWADGP